MLLHGQKSSAKVRMVSFLTRVYTTFLRKETATPIPEVDSYGTSATAGSDG